MSLFDRLFGKKTEPKYKRYEKFQLLNGYEPHFTRWGGSIYESELVRAAINARATHISKLKVETRGSAKPKLQTKLKHGPNEWQSWSQWLYRTSTILDCLNNAVIIPILDSYGETSGIYTLLPDRCTIVEYDGIPYMRYEFMWGKHAAIELDKVGILTKMQYRDDFFGETNHALTPTMELIKMQDDGIKEGVKSAASYTFMARVDNFSKVSDLKNEAKRFTKENLMADDDSTGILLFPNTYNDIKQIETKPFVADADQMSLINENVFNYFGVNKDILQNHFDSETWAAFYEGCCEPFAIQLSECLSRMLFTYIERSNGNRVDVTANRLQYMSNQDKLNVSAQMLDRGIMTINEIRQIWQLPELENGDVRIIRGEYYNADEKVTEEES